MKRTTTITAEQVAELQKAVNDLVQAFNGKKELTFGTVRKLDDLGCQLHSQLIEMGLLAFLPAPQDAPQDDTLKIYRVEETAFDKATEFDADVHYVATPAASHEQFTGNLDHLVKHYGGKVKLHPDNSQVAVIDNGLTNSEMHALVNRADYDHFLCTEADLEEYYGIK